MKTKIKIPTHFMGKPIKGAIERVFAEKPPVNEDQEDSQENITTQANINPREYIQIPGTNKVISVNQMHNGKNYEETHRELLSKGLIIPTIAEFMIHFQNVVNTYNGNSKLHYADSTQVQDSLVNDLYKFLTTDHNFSGVNGVWVWLNGKFIQGNGFNNLDLETITGLSSTGELLTTTQPLQNYLTEDCFIDFNSLNNQGLPIKKEGDNYQKGKNIYFWTPKDQRVARFGSASVRASLGCGRGPSNSDDSLGVFACAKGTRP